MREMIQYVEVEDEPSLTGWWILNYDDGDDSPFDQNGPYDTREEAERVMSEEASAIWMQVP